MTPVDAGYIEHLEKVRGETKMLKVMEKAREAVANGSAGTEEFEIATNGVKVNGDGSLVAANEHSEERYPLTDADDLRRTTNGKRNRESDDDNRPPRDRMDISLHNFGDYSHDRQG